MVEATRKLREYLNPDTEQRFQVATTHDESVRDETVFTNLGLSPTVYEATRQQPATNGEFAKGASRHPRGRAIATHGRVPLRRAQTGKRPRPFVGVGPVR
jgi:hypothetical protein